MKHRLARLGLVAGVAVAAMPLTQPAHAFMCPPEVHVVCSTYSLVCQTLPDSSKDNVHEILCESFS